MERVNYIRTRNFLSTLSNEELIDLRNHAKEDIEYNSAIIAYLADLELEERTEREKLSIRKAIQKSEE